MSCKNASSSKSDNSCKNETRMKMTPCKKKKKNFAKVTNNLGWNRSGGNRFKWELIRWDLIRLGVNGVGFDSGAIRLRWKMLIHTYQTRKIYNRVHKTFKFLIEENHLMQKIIFRLLKEL